MPPWMATANDKNFSNARWQAQGPKLLESTMVKVYVMTLNLSKVDFIYMEQNMLYAPSLSPSLPLQLKNWKNYKE